MYISQKYIRKNFTTHSCNAFDFRNESIEILLKINENMVLTSFLDLFQPPSKRISLILYLNFVHVNQNNQITLTLVQTLGKKL